MKKCVEFKSDNKDPYCTLNCANDVLKNWGILYNWNPILEFERKEKPGKVIARWGNEKCGILHTFKREKEVSDVYVIDATYELYGLKEKNKLTIDRKYSMSRMDGHLVEFKVTFSGSDDFCGDVEKIIKTDFNL